MASTASRSRLCLLGSLLAPLALLGCAQPEETTFSLATSLTNVTLTNATDPTDETSTSVDTDPTMTDTDPTLTDPTMTDTDPTMTDTDPTMTDTDPTLTDPTMTDTDPTMTDTDPTATDTNCDDGDSGIEPFDDPPVYDAIDPVEMPHGPFVPLEDFGSPSECDIFQQDCPIGEKCVPYSSTGGNWDADKCVPVQGNGMVGEACVYGGVVEATDDCDENSACWDVMDINGQPVGTCTAFCTGDAQAPVCAPGTSCLISGDGAIAFCVDTCNPLVQDCPVGEACFWANSEFNCIFTTSDFSVGQPCGFINDCAEGLMCLNASVLPNCAGSACCGEFCDLDCGMGSCSQPGTQCVAFFEQGMAPFGNGDVGVCILP